MTATHQWMTSPQVVKTLRNGDRYRLRAPRPEDSGQVAECFERLSSESRRRRFFAFKKALTDSEVEFLTMTDGDDHIAVAAMALDNNGLEGRMVGMARCLRLPAPPDSAELAIAIADEAQGLGLGRALIGQLMQAADAQGIRNFEVEVMADNAGMRALAERFGASSARQEDGTMHYRIPVGDDIASGPGAQTAWPWLQPTLGFEAAQRDWLESTDQVFRLGQGLAENLWQSIWDSWHPSWRKAVTEDV
ncbi:MAG: GNAT family N-acetyltransferase [Thiohalocapsa sp.]